MNVIKKIAEKNGVTEKEVREEILIAIKAARENSDSKVQAMWKIMFPSGKEPTPEEFIMRLSEKIKKKTY